MRARAERRVPLRDAAGVVGTIELRWFQRRPRMGACARIEDPADEKGADFVGGWVPSWHKKYAASEETQITGPKVGESKVAPKAGAVSGDLENRDPDFLG